MSLQPDTIAVALCEMLGLRGFAFSVLCGCSPAFCVLGDVQGERFEFGK